MASLDTPEERLCSRSWRLKNSAWLLWSILSAGLFTGVGFLIHAIAMKNKKMFIFAGAWILAAVIYFVFSSFIDSGTKENPAQTTEAKLLGGYITAVFIGGVTHSALTNRSWLRWKAHNSGSNGPWYAGSSQPSNQLKTPTKSATEALSSVGVGSGAESNTMVDVNTATPDQLIAQGFDAASASKIVSEKSKSGPYTSQDDLLQRSGVAPHIVLSAGSALEYTQQGPGTRPKAPSSVDGASANRRKLDF